MKNGVNFDTRPRTKNGVLIRAGQLLWCMGGNHVEKVKSVRGGVVRSAYAGTICRGGIMNPSGWYSTAAAAHKGASPC